LVDAIEEPVTLTRLNGDQTVTVPDDSLKPAPIIAEPLRLAHASGEEPLVPVAAGSSVSTPLEGVKVDAPLEAVAKQPATIAPARPKFAFDFQPTTYKEEIAPSVAPIGGGIKLETPLEEVAKKVVTTTPTTASAPVVEAPLEEVAKKIAAGTTATTAVAPIQVEAPLEEVAKKVPAVTKTVAAAPAAAAPI